MSKNLTRKGLAFGAVVALGSTLFAGTPAQAADVTISPTVGAEFKVLTLDDFTGVVALDSALPAANISQLKYKIEKTAAVTVVAKATSDGSFPGSSTGYLSLGTSTASGVVTPEATSTTAGNKFNLVVSGADEDTVTTAVTVTAWLDSDGMDDVDGGEKQVSQVITFVKPSEAAFTTNLVQPYVAESSLVATVEIAGINLAQTDSVKIAFSKDGSTPFTTEYENATAGTFDAGTNITHSGTKAAAYDSTTTSSTYGKLTASYSKPGLTAHDQVTGATLNAGTAAFAVANDSKYQAQASVTTSQGSASIKSVSAQTLATIATGVTAATGVKSTAGLATAAASTATDSTVDVRSNVSGFEVFATFKDGTADADGGPKVIAGLPVTVVASTADSNVIAADGIKVGGKAFDDSTDVTLNLTTDANGQVKIAVTSTAIDSGDDIKFVFTAQGKTTATANNDTTFDGGVVTATWADATYSIIETADVTGAGTTKTIAPKGSYTVEYKLFDQWGDAPADNAYRLSIALTNDSRTGNATWEYYPVVLGGKVSQTITDKLVGEESSITVTVGIQTYPAGSGYTSGAIDTASHTLVISNTATVNAITLGNATVTDATAVELKNVVASTDQATNFTSSNKNYRLSQKAFANFDGRTSTATAPEVEQSLALEINGTVQGGSFASGIAGVPVTISGADLQFRAVVKGSDGAATIAASTALKNIYATNSLTLLSEADGDFGFQVWSHKSGSQTVTITAGGVSKTVTLSFAALAAEANKAIVASVPATVKAGRTVPVTAFVADKWGNGVPGISVTFDSTGVGYLNATSGTTDANGKAVVRLLLGNGDVGLATVSAKYTQSSVDYTNSANALVGVSATVSAGKKLASATVKNALGLTVKVVSGTKVVSKVATSDSFKVSLTKLTAGKKTVKVYVNDVLVTSKSVTVKK